MKRTKIASVGDLNSDGRPEIVSSYAVLAKGSGERHTVHLLKDGATTLEDVALPVPLAEFSDAVLQKGQVISFSSETETPFVFHWWGHVPLSEAGQGLIGTPGLYQILNVKARVTGDRENGGLRVMYELDLAVLRNPKDAWGNDLSMMRSGWGTSEGRCAITVSLEKGSLSGAKAL